MWLPGVKSAGSNVALPLFKSLIIELSPSISHVIVGDVIVVNEIVIQFPIEGVAIPFKRIAPVAWS